MAEKSRSRRPIAIILLVLVLLLIVAGLLWYVQTQRLATARARFHPPQVYLTNPAQGQQQVVGTHMMVTASASTQNPIISIELWLDGAFVEEYRVEEGGAGEVLYGNFSIPVFEGVHMLTVRATDVTGLVGNSLPVGFEGVRFTQGELYLLQQPFNPAIPVEETARQLDGDPGMAIDFNPQAASGEYPVGAPIEIPIHPIPEEGQPEPIPPDEIGLNGDVSGKLCFPSEYIPAMTVFFENASTGQVTQLQIAENQFTYQQFLPSGSYTAYAWLLDNSMGGLYSYAVPCGLDVSCTNHNPLPFDVFSGITTTDIDLCDWYSQPDVPKPSKAAAPEPAPSGVQILEVDKVLPLGNQFDLPFVFGIPLSAPPAPTDFKASLKNCNVELSWRSSGELANGYSVWFAAQSGLQQLIASLKPGSGETLGYTFQPPTPGTFTVWVEAYNALGTQSSTPALVTVTDDCASTVEDTVRIETREISVPPSYQQVYVYLSIDGQPEIRIPADDSEFVFAEGGRASFEGATRDAGIVTFPRPESGSLELSADCWGWEGGVELSKIASFTAVLTSSDWDAGMVHIGDERCGLNLALSSQGGGQSYSPFGGTAGGVPAPFNVREIRVGSDDGFDPDQEWSWFWEREIRWQWTGKIKDITGFTISLNGKALATVPAKERRWTVILPEWCGAGSNWTVTANAKQGKSPNSQPAFGPLPNCPAYVIVGIEKLELIRTCDGHCFEGSAPCDTLDAYWTIGAGPIQWSFYDGPGVYYGLACGDHRIADMNPVPRRHVFILPVRDFTKPTSYRVFAEFWDYDAWSANDLIFGFDRTFGFKTLNQAKQMVQNCYGSNAAGTLYPIDSNSSILSDNPKLDAACGYVSAYRKNSTAKGRIQIWWGIWEPSSTGK
jgi:hypothetical protein